MAKLIPLIPLREIRSYRARSIESVARKQFATKKDALQAARFRILTAPGCHGEAYPPVEGWVLTMSAAIVIASEVTTMPGGTCHCRRTWDRYDG